PMSELRDGGRPRQQVARGSRRRGQVARVRHAALRADRVARTQCSHDASLPGLLREEVERRARGALRCGGRRPRADGGRPRSGCDRPSRSLRQRSRRPRSRYRRSDRSDRTGSKMSQNSRDALDLPPRVRKILEQVYAVEGVAAARVWLWEKRVALGVRGTAQISPPELLRRVEIAIAQLREADESWEFGLLGDD